MPTRTAPEPPRYDATVQRDPKNVFDRDPLLIPQLFVDPIPPWYRRRSRLALAAIAAFGVVVLTFALYRYGLGGTASRAARVAGGVLRTFARIGH